MSSLLHQGGWRLVVFPLLIVLRLLVPSSRRGAIGRRRKLSRPQPGAPGTATVSKRWHGLSVTMTTAATDGAAAPDAAPPAVAPPAVAPSSDDGDEVWKSGTL